MINENFITKSKNIHGDKYDYSLVDYKNNKTKVKIICIPHGIFEQRPNDHLNGNGCPICANKYKPTTDEFVSKSKNIHGDKYDYSLVDYKNNKTKVKIICPTHGIFEQRPTNHLYGQSCPTCSNSLTTEDFVNNSKNIHGDKYDYSLVQYKDYKTKVKIICPKHGIFEQTPNNHLKGKVCYKCVCTYKKTTEEFVKNVTKIHGDRYDYSLVDYKNNITKVKIICPTHGIFEQRPNDHLNGNGCPCCKTSKGELNIKMILDKNNIKYIQQHKFDDCRYINPLPFDFYLPHLNTCIEYDGIQHFEPVVFFGGERGLSILQRTDLIKNNYCMDNNIILIRVDYKGNLLIYGY